MHIEKWLGDARMQRAIFGLNRAQLEELEMTFAQVGAAQEQQRRPRRQRAAGGGAKRQIRSLAEFAAAFPGVGEVLVDGFERRIARPKKASTNRKHYSGKKKAPPARPSSWWMGRGASACPP